MIQPTERGAEPVDSGLCPDCDEAVEWQRADELIWDYVPYPEINIRKVIEVFGSDTRMWGCYGCGAYGLSAGLKLSW